jgi:hypothetical protein
MLITLFAVNPAAESLFNLFDAMTRQADNGLRPVSSIMIENDRPVPFYHSHSSTPSFERLGALQIVEEYNLTYLVIHFVSGGDDMQLARAAFLLW